jgi:N-acetylmuramoyl-L-alanine amidase
MRIKLISAAVTAALLASTGAFLIIEPSFAYGTATEEFTAADGAAVLPMTSSAAVEIMADDLISENIGEDDAAKDDSLEDVLKAQAAAALVKTSTSAAVSTKTVKPALAAAPTLSEKPKKTTRAASLSAQVAGFGAPASLDKEMHCLAGAVYFESKGESLNGQLAVAHVVLNRAASGRFPGSICGVVYQRSQFSFVRGGRMPSIAMNSQDWREAVAIAQLAKEGTWDSPVGKALFFHASRVSPGWKLKRVAQIDNHIFYR